MDVADDHGKDAKPELGVAEGREGVEDLDREIWRCLNSVHDILGRRQILNQTLRKGWMELAGARYEMGPTRISQVLFSLKAQAAKAVVNVTSPPHTAGLKDGDDEICDEEVSGNGPVIFELVKDASKRGQMVTDGTNSNLWKKKKKPMSQLRRRPVSTSAVQVEYADSEKEGLLEYSNLIDDSDSEDDQKPLEVQKNSLQGFGAMVVPNLRLAQGSFVKALQVIMEVLNAESDATDAHRNVTRLRASTHTFVGQ